MTYRLRMEDCHALLSYLSKHRGEPQSYPKLDEATGIPRSTIHAIITEARYNRNSLLSTTAHRYGFVYRLFNRPECGEGGPIIDVVYNGPSYKLQLQDELEDDKL